MPLCFWNASRLGRDLPSSLVSMYSVQFDQLTTFSVSDMSFAAAAVFAAAVPDAPPVEAFLPEEPQAARKAAAPTPAAPIMAERRLTSPRMRAARRIGLSLSKEFSFMGSFLQEISWAGWRGSTLTLGSCWCWCCCAERFVRHMSSRRPVRTARAHDSMLAMTCLMRV